MFGVMKACEKLYYTTFMARHGAQSGAGMWLVYSCWAVIARQLGGRRARCFCFDQGWIRAFYLPQADSDPDRELDHDLEQIRVVNRTRL